MTSWQAVLRTDNTLTNHSEALRTDIGHATRPRAIPQSTLILAAITRLRSAWRWVERKRVLQLTSRRLRVAETISLGEKRFVSIIQVDGAQFLIGGSATNVQLLACLDPLAPPTSTLATDQAEETR